MNCPRCDYTLERHAPLAGEGTPYPESGDLTLCFGCGALLVFDGNADPRGDPGGNP